MTLIILAVLAAAWLGYFALWFRDRQASRPMRGDSFGGTSQYFDRRSAVTSGPRAAFAGIGGVAVSLLEPPRTRQQASLRRRQVATVLVVAALASLLAVPVFGSPALGVHIVADLALVLFAYGSVNRQQAQAANLAEVRVLYPDRPAASDAVVMPLQQVVNG